MNNTLLCCLVFLVAHVAGDMSNITTFYDQCIENERETVCIGYDISLDKFYYDFEFPNCLFHKTCDSLQKIKLKNDTGEGEIEWISILKVPEKTSETYSHTIIGLVTIQSSFYVHFGLSNKSSSEKVVNCLVTKHQYPYLHNESMLIEVQDNELGSTDYAVCRFTMPIITVKGAYAIRRVYLALGVQRYARKDNKRTIQAQKTTFFLLPKYNWILDTCRRSETTCVGASGYSKELTVEKDINRKSGCIYRVTCLFVLAFFRWGENDMRISFIVEVDSRMSRVEINVTIFNPNQEQSSSVLQFIMDKGTPGKCGRLTLLPQHATEVGERVRGYFRMSDLLNLGDPYKLMTIYFDSESAQVSNTVYHYIHCEFDASNGILPYYFRFNADKQVTFYARYLILRNGTTKTWAIDDETEKNVIFWLKKAPTTSTSAPVSENTEEFTTLIITGSTKATSTTATPRNRTTPVFPVVKRKSKYKFWVIISLVVAIFAGTIYYCWTKCYGGEKVKKKKARELSQKTEIVKRTKKTIIKLPTSTALADEDICQELPPESFEPDMVQTV